MTELLSSFSGMVGGGCQNGLAKTVGVALFQVFLRVHGAGWDGTGSPVDKKVTGRDGTGQARKISRDGTLPSRPVTARKSRLGKSFAFFDELSSNELSPFVLFILLADRLFSETAPVVLTLCGRKPKTQAAGTSVREGHSASFGPFWLPTRLSPSR